MSGYRIVMSDAHLEHNGILGMKWGVRNGPPYPLTPNMHSKREIDANYKKSLNGKTNKDQYGRKTSKTKDFQGLTDQQKQLIKTGAIIAGGILVAYGGYKLSSNPHFRQMMLNGMDRIKKTPDINSLIENSGPEIVKKETFGSFSELDNKVIKHFGLLKDRSISQNLTRVSAGNVGLHDCGNGSMALIEGQNSGLKLKAKDINHNMSWDDVKKIYPGSTTRPVLGPDTDDTVDGMGKYLAKTFKEGDNGLIGLITKDSSQRGNHFIAFEIKDQKTIVYDHQFKVNSLKGLEMATDGSWVKLNGRKIEGSEAKEFVNMYFINYNVLSSNCTNLKNQAITSDLALLKEYFE